jgi:hypothetical protein
LQHQLSFLKNSRTKIVEMNFSGFQKYFLILMLSCGIAKGNNAFSSPKQLHLLSTVTSLQENYKKIPLFIVGEFVEEIENDENPDEIHADFNFTTPTIDIFDFNIISQSLHFTPKNYSFKIALNQKIHVLNCTFLI